jgi:uncharacterized protein YegL
MKGLSGNGNPVHVALVLDRSGSMESARDETISGFNEYIQAIRETAEREELEVRVTLTTFNHQVQIEYVDAPLSRLETLTRATYQPDGMTAMLDAVGETIERLTGAPEDDTFLVSIFSDGLENASERYTYKEIAERIQRLTETGRWTFTYLGANQDLSQVSRDLNIDPGNVAAYQASPAGTAQAWRRHAARSATHLESVARNQPSAPFYDESDDNS